MAYWWASQGTNYEIAIGQGLLWTCPMKNNIVPPDRSSLKEMRVGDIVFHYQGPAIRAISSVTEESAEAPRPPVGYPKVDEREADIGWQVRVTPLHVDLNLSSDRARELIRHGDQGPLDKLGTPLRKYVSALTDEEGVRLLRELGLTVPPPPLVEEGAAVLPAVLWSGDGTDAVVLGTVRREQGQLRKYHLANRAVAPCAICGRELPALFLIAGHIKPRWMCSDVERSDLANVAMLVCALGCDALFELGYIIVGSDGRVSAGRPTESEDLKLSVEALVGNICAQYEDGTAAYFAERARLALG